MQVEAKPAVSREEAACRPASAQNLAPNKIFVGGLPATVNENALRNYFEGFGPVTDAVVLYDRETNRPRGFGFITFSTRDSLERVRLHVLDQAFCLGTSNHMLA
jgi:RNA recognition motif-containing protein